MLVDVFTVYSTTSALLAGFNVETVEYKNISFTVWDVGGQDKVLLRTRFLADAVLVHSSNVLVFSPDPPTLETLFPEHSRTHLCRRQ